MYHTLTMTDMTKDEAIKYLQQLYPNGGCSWLDEQRIEAISMAIDALKEKPVSEDLEQAADEYSDRILSENRGKYNPDWNTYADGYEQSICAHVYPAFIDGAKWQKEQIMKDAIKGTVDWLDGPFLNFTQKEQDDALERIGAKIGDKVKIVIIKEEKQ